MDIRDADLIKKYLEIKDCIEKLEALHAEKLKPFKEAQETISNALLARLNERGAQNTVTPEGTAYKSTTMKAKVENRDTFLAFVMDAFDQWGDMLMASPQIDAVKRYLERDENNIPPPGVSLSFFTKCNIRRS